MTSQNVIISCLQLLQLMLLQSHSLHLHPPLCSRRHTHILHVRTMYCSSPMQTLCALHAPYFTTVQVLVFAAFLVDSMGGDVAAPVSTCDNNARRRRRSVNNRLRRPSDATSPNAPSHYTKQRTYVLISLLTSIHPINVLQMRIYSYELLETDATQCVDF